MIYLLDTSIVSRLMQRHETTKVALRTRTAEPAAHQVMICSITRGEILFGVERLPHGRKRAELATEAERYLGLLPNANVSAATATQYARIKQESRRRGRALDENDLWIAAAALETGAVLVTCDGDFGWMDELRVEDWSRGVANET